jgi:hypothetical protein
LVLTDFAPTRIKAMLVTQDCQTIATSRRYRLEKQIGTWCVDLFTGTDLDGSTSLLFSKLLLVCRVYIMSLCKKLALLSD